LIREDAMNAITKVEPIRARCEVLRFEARLSSVGNPDFGQYAPLSEPCVVRTASLKEMRTMIAKYIEFWDLGGGNFVDPVVKRDGRKIGTFSYNRRYWRFAKTYPVTFKGLKAHVTIPESTR